MNSSTERSVIEAPEMLMCSETGAPARSRSADQLQRLADHPAVELLDHPRALGHLDEGGGRQQLAALAGHPQQQLVALDPARGEVADRLGREAQAVLGEGVADPGAGRLRRGCRARAFVAGRVEERDPVPPLGLRLVHRLVGGDQHRLGAGPPLPPNIVIPTLIVAVADLRVERHALGDLGAQVLAELQGAGGVGLRHQHRELVAGEPGDDVGRPHPFAQDLGDAADQVVAGLVAEPVVDPLQPVDVDHHHRAAAAVAGGEGDVLVELGAEAAPVEQPGQRVVVGEVAQLGLGLLGPFQRAGPPPGPRARAWRAPRPRRVRLAWIGAGSSPVQGN